MNEESISNQLCEQYSAGERIFSQINLQEANLEKAFLSRIDLSNSDLSYANLELVNLNHASLKESSLVEANLSRANLFETNFNKADLTGANVTGANITGANFAYANLSKANFSVTKLFENSKISGNQNNNSQEITKYNKVNFYGAILTGAFFIGVNLSFANLERAVYDDKTNFPSNFNPGNVGMVHIRMMQTVALDQLLAKFNYSFSFANRYLGAAITTKYFYISRPDFEWLEQFQIDSMHRISFLGTVSSFVSVEQLTSFQEWIDTFHLTCAKIIKNFPG